MAVGTCEGPERMRVSGAMTIRLARWIAPRRVGLKRTSSNILRLSLPRNIEGACGRIQPTLSIVTSPGVSGYLCESDDLDGWLAERICKNRSAARCGLRLGPVVERACGRPRSADGVSRLHRPGLSPTTRRKVRLKAA